MHTPRIHQSKYTGYMHTVLLIYVLPICIRLICWFFLFHLFRLCGVLAIFSFYNTQIKINSCTLFSLIFIIIIIMFICITKYLIDFHLLFDRTQKKTYYTTKIGWNYNNNNNNKKLQPQLFSFFFFVFFVNEIVLNELGLRVLKSWFYIFLLFSLLFIFSLFIWQKETNGAEIPFMAQLILFTISSHFNFLHMYGLIHFGNEFGEGKNRRFKEIESNFKK